MDGSVRIMGRQRHIYIYSAKERMRNVKYGPTEWVYIFVVWMHVKNPVSNRKAGRSKHS